MIIVNSYFLPNFIIKEQEMAAYYFLRIKKAYATAVIEDLQKMDAVELVEPEDTDIPEWQKKEVRSRLKELKKDPTKGVSFSTAQKKIKTALILP
jgi:hypothetical protein